MEASHHKCKSPKGIFTSLSEEECRRDCTSGQSNCLNAISLKSIPGAGIGDGWTSVEDSGRTTEGGSETGLLRRVKGVVGSWGSETNGGAGGGVPTVDGAEADGKSSLGVFPFPWQVEKDIGRGV